jgi:hypothetical protein
VGTPHLSHYPYMVLKSQVEFVMYYSFSWQQLVVLMISTYPWKAGRSVLWSNKFSEG